MIKFHPWQHDVESHDYANQWLSSHSMLVRKIVNIIIRRGGGVNWCIDKSTTEGHLIRNVISFCSI